MKSWLKLIYEKLVKINIRFIYFEIFQYVLAKENVFFINTGHFTEN